MSRPESSFPHFFRLRQRFASHAIADLDAAVSDALHQVSMASRIQSGHRVAIAVGSRGIANLSKIVAAVVRFVNDCGGQPLIVPAMGSHGGATAEGQTAVLAGYGITAESMGCPVDASMETILVGTTVEGLHVHFSESAGQADHIIVVNRIKPHTKLAGKYESGLIKMMMIGLGKHRGASLYHQYFPDYDYRLDEFAPGIAEMIIDKMPVSIGLGIVEDAFEQTSLIEAVDASDLVSREPELLEIAKSRMPRLPFDHADLLIVDRIGKEISGTGMDTNVIGRKSNDRCAAPDEYPKVRQIYVRSLSEKTDGNAAGIGLSEYCHRNVVEAMNAEVTRINCVTAAHVTGGAVPLTFDSDRDVLEAVVSQTAAHRVADLKWMWITDTLHLDHLACSRVFWDAARSRDDIEVLSEPQPLTFDDNGNLIDFSDE